MSQDQSAGAIATWRHTIIVCCILAAIALAGFAASQAGGGQSPPGAGPGAPLYLSLIAAELGLFALIRAGIRGRGVGIAGLIRPTGWTARGLAADVLLAIALLAAWLALETLLDRWLPAQSGIVQRMLVRNAADIPLWIALSLAAGFVEELVYRGYLQRQFSAKAGPLLAIAGQALLFGVTHGYQGIEPMLRITCFGLLFGAVAWGRRSLVPGMIAHAAVDVIGGLQLLR